MYRGNKNLKKRFKRFEKKRQAVLDYLSSLGVDVERLKDDADICMVAYDHFNKPFPEGNHTIANYHSYFSAILMWGNISRECVGETKIKRSWPIDAAKAAQFYRSHDWKRARYDALMKSDGRCECCGRSRADGATLNVDHIKPVKKYWNLRLDLDNLQVLCGSCNAGKGNRDETDWRVDNMPHPARWYREYC